MKVALLRLTGMGVAFSVIVTVITSLIVGFGLVIAYILTLTIKNLEMAQALTSGAIFSVFSLYFCFRLLTYTMEERNASYLCNECAGKDESESRHFTQAQRPSVWRTVKAKKSRRKSPNG